MVGRSAISTVALGSQFFRASWTRVQACGSSVRGNRCHVVPVTACRSIARSFRSGNWSHGRLFPTCASRHNRARSRPCWSGNLASCCRGDRTCFRVSAGKLKKSVGRLQIVLSVQKRTSAWGRNFFRTRACGSDVIFIHAAGGCASLLGSATLQTCITGGNVRAWLRRAVLHVFWRCSVSNNARGGQLRRFSSCCGIPAEASLAHRSAAAVKELGGPGQAPELACPAGLSR